MLDEFKRFAMRGNVMDMAIGIIIGAAFGKIIDSLVKDILMPPLGLILGKVDFSHLDLMLQAQTATAPAVVIHYGLFINTIVNFTIVSFAIFMFIKQMNRVMPIPVSLITTKTCPYCCQSIASKATKCPHCTSEVSSET